MLFNLHIYTSAQLKYTRKKYLKKTIQFNSKFYIILNSYNETISITTK